jgi:hypothetical protein
MIAVLIKGENLDKRQFEQKKMIQRHRGKCHVKMKDWSESSINQKTNIKP